MRDENKILFRSWFVEEEGYRIEGKKYRGKGGILLRHFSMLFILKMIESRAYL